MLPDRLAPPACETATALQRRATHRAPPCASYRCLASDSSHEGGRLLALCDGRVQAIERLEGEAIIHPSTLLHGVSRMRKGGAIHSSPSGSSHRHPDPHRRDQGRGGGRDAASKAGGNLELFRLVQGHGTLRMALRYSRKERKTKRGSRRAEDLLTVLPSVFQADRCGG